jgi:hypothetical protein
MVPSRNKLIIVTTLIMGRTLIAMTTFIPRALNGNALWIYLYESGYSILIKNQLISQFRVKFEVFNSPMRKYLEVKTIQNSIAQ